MKKHGKRMKVVFVDDNDDFLKAWRDKFRQAAPKGVVDLKESSRDDLKNAVRALDRSRADARKSKEFKMVDGAALFNDADLVFVDYDLIELEDTTALSGEDIAYLLRCFTTCGFIVLLNPPDLGENFFDLRLRRSFDSWADLVLGTDQLNNPWLWNNEPDGFSPWSWPCLTDAVARCERQVQRVAGSIDKPILDMLNVPDGARVALDHAMAEPVSTRMPASKAGKSAIKAPPDTVRKFVFESGYGIHRRDKVAFQDADQQVARIAAARLASWFEHVVLPAQSMLVDAPHVVARLPGLLAGDPMKLSAWNSTAARDHEELSKAVRERELKPYRLADQFWLSRPVWFWPLIASDPRYIDWAQVEKMADVAFCEDTSRFVKRSDAHEFMAEVPPQFARRYVQMPKADGGAHVTEYRPSVRLSM